MSRFKEIIKWWLLTIPLLLIIQSICAKSLERMSFTMLARGVKFLDEITIAMLILPSIYILYKRRWLVNPLYLILTIPLIAFCIFGIISGLKNNNSLIITSLGIFDYIKYPLLIFIYAAFLPESGYFKKIFRFLLIAGIVISIGVLLEEGSVLFFRYILGRDIRDPMVYILRPLPISMEAVDAAWRFGIYRAGLFLSSNTVGYFLLLCLVIYIYTAEKKNMLVISSLVLAILSTVSRSAYASLFILAVIQILKDKKTLLLPVLFIFLSLMTYMSLVSRVGETGDYTFRSVVVQQAIKVFNDHPVFGVGPGMYGGMVSLYFKSPLLERYYIPNYMRRYIGGIDQFWPQVIAEMGIGGLILFIAMVIAIVRVLFMLKGINKTDGELVSGLVIFWIVIYLFTLGTGFNTTIVSFPFFAFIGISTGTAMTKTDKSCYE